MQVKESERELLMEVVFELGLERGVTLTHAEV